MNGNLAGFDAEQVEPQDSFDPLPARWYQVIISDSEMKPTKKNDGQYLQLELEVIEGEYQGRKVWDRLNLDNPNNTAVEIAQRALSAICRAVGVMAPNDSTELHDRPFEVKLSVKPAKGEYEASNEVKGYRALGEAPAAPTAPPSTARAGRTTPRAAAGQKATPPWKRG
jgi:hypothetical protein